MPYDCGFGVRYQHDDVPSNCGWGSGINMMMCLRIVVGDQVSTL